MQEKIKVLTIGDCQNSTLENYFKDNENIEFLGLALNENTEKLNNKLSNRNVVFLRSKEDNLEKLLEIGKVLKEKEIITVTILEEKLVIENKEILEKSFNTIFPVTRKDDIENLLSELIKMIDDVIYGNGFINLDIEDVKSILKDLGISIFGALNKNKEKSEQATAIVAEKNANVAVRADIVDFRSVNTQYEANGTFQAKQEVALSAETQGRVIRVLVNEGSRVGAGQVLAIIKGEQQNVNVQNAQAVYNNALAEVKRFESAYASGGVTKQQLDQVRLQAQTAKNSLQSAQLSASDVNVRASFSGIINKKNIEPGSFVAPGQALFEIVNIGTLKLEVKVDEKHIGSVRVGQTVEVSSSVYPDEKYSGVVTFVAPKADASLNFPVEVEIKNNTNNTLKAGMYGTAYFGEKESSQILTVPRTAFVGSVSSNQVYVIKNGKAELKTITSGRNFGDYIEVLSGLSKGDQVVTTGQVNLSDQTPVEIIK